MVVLLLVLASCLAAVILTPPLSVYSEQPCLPPHVHARCQANVDPPVGSSAGLGGHDGLAGVRAAAAVPARCHAGQRLGHVRSSALPGVRWL